MRRWLSSLGESNIQVKPRDQKIPRPWRGSGVSRCGAGKGNTSCIVLYIHRKHITIRLAYHERNSPLTLQGRVRSITWATTISEFYIFITVQNFHIPIHACLSFDDIFVKSSHFCFISVSGVLYSKLALEAIHRDR
jgi:hypothetical protein